jgi:hypothetical protein
MKSRLLKDVNEFLLRNPIFFARILSIHHPIKQDTLLSYCYKWDWYDLTKSMNINWDIRLLKDLEKYLSKFSNYELDRVWSNLSWNKAIQWNPEIIERYKTKLTFSAVLKSRNLKWSDQVDHLLKNHIDELSKPTDDEFNLNFIHVSDCLKAVSGSSSIPWSIEFVNSNNSIVDWKSLSANNGNIWSEHFLSEFENSLDWSELSSNTGLPWSSDLIEKYYSKWDWYCLSGNPKLPWSDSFIDKYADKFWFKDDSQPHWPKSLSTNGGVNWNEYLMNKYSEKVSWYHLSYRVPFSLGAIEKYRSKIWFNMLSSNHSIHWTPEFIEKNTFPGYRSIESGKLSAMELLSRSYQGMGNNLDWKALSWNSSVPWDINFISKHVDQIDWQQFSKNKGKFWTEEIIEKFKNKLHFKRAQYALDPNLSDNESLPWSVEFLLKYESLWDYYELAKNKEVYRCLAPYITDGIVNEIMNTLPNFKFLKQ